MSPLPASVAHGRIEHIPRVHEFDIGQYNQRRPAGDTVEDDQIVIMRREENRPNHLIHGFVENFSEDGVDFTFSIEESDDNGVSDAYAARNIRVAGASVSDVVVKPKGTVEFLIEGLTEQYLKFLANDQNLSHGRLVLTHFFGKLERNHRELVP